MPSGKHREGYEKPRTGERRKQRKPLKLDRYPQEVRDEILRARAQGCTWLEVAEHALRAAAKTSGLAGTEPVSAPDQKTLEAWAELCRRWYDLRVEQVQQEVMQEAEVARQIAAAFAGKPIENLPEATRNALATLVFSLLESKDEATKKRAIADLKDISLIIQRTKMLDIQQAQVETKNRELELRIEEMTRKAQKVTKQIERAADGKPADLKALAAEVRKIYEGR